MLRFPIRFSLRTAFGVMFLFAIAAALAGNWLERNRRNEAAMYSLSSRGGATLAFHGDVQVVAFRNAPSCWSIEGLDIYKSMDPERNGTYFADADVSVLTGLRSRLVVDLEGTQITDDAVDSLARLENLRVVCDRQANLSASARKRLRKLRPDVILVDEIWMDSDEVENLILPKAARGVNTDS